LILNPLFDYSGIKTDAEFTNAQLDELAKYGKLKNVFLNDGFIDLRKNGGNDIANPACFAGENTVVISPENELILPCYHLGLEKFKIEKNLDTIWNSNQVKISRKQAGKLKECQSCTINCYMQPSFSTHLNKYFFKSLPSTMKYNLIKGTWKQLF
jgi:hypothetical protein